MYCCLHVYRLALSIWLCFSLLLSGCCAVPPATEEELQRELDSLVEEARREVVRQLEEAKKEVLRFAKEWAGLEAPAEVGVLDEGVVTATQASTIEAAFADAYKRIGGARRIGWPEGKVTLTAGLLIQYYSSLSQERSAIVMREDETTAYAIPGPWLAQYEALGGPARAGYPTTDPETWGTPRWKIWVRLGRGDRQLYSVDGEVYALMKAAGSPSVRCVPPRFWDVYIARGGLEKVGYPISSYPLDDSAWQNLPGLTDDTHALLATWSEQPYRTMIFEKGAILFTSDWERSEVVKAEPLSGGETQLVGAVGTVFTRKYLDLDAPDECSLETFQFTGNAGNREWVMRLGTRISFAPLEGSLTVASGAAESPLCRMALAGARYLLKMAHADDPKTETLAFVAGMVLDRFYAKAVGDFLSKPLTQLTVESAKLEFASLYTHRLHAKMSVSKSDSPIRGSPTMNVYVFAMYDEYTHMVSGMVKSDCAPDGFGFQFRADPTSAMPVGAEGVWDGRARFWSLVDGTSR